MIHSDPQKSQGRPTFSSSVIPVSSLLRTMAKKPFGMPWMRMALNLGLAAIFSFFATAMISHARITNWHA